MTATDIGCLVSPPSESASATGSEPIIVETVVISMARRRSGPALTTAATLSSPAARSWLMKSTSNIALLTTTPTKRMMPMKLISERRSPVSASRPKEPAVIRGRENITVKGWTNDSNCIAITM